MFLPHHVRSIGDAIVKEEDDKTVVTISITEIEISLEEGHHLQRHQRTGRCLKMFFSQIACHHITHHTSSDESEPLDASSLISSSNIQVKCAKVLYSNDRKRYNAISSRLHNSESSPWAYVGIDGSVKREGCLEYAVDVRLVPMRCYLDDSVAVYVDHILYSYNRATSSFPAKDHEMNNNSVITHVKVQSVQIKVDYVYENLNVYKLRQGDKHQLLSIFPLKGLQIDFPQVHVKGKQFQSALRDIVSFWKSHLDQLPVFKFIGTTVQLKGIANVMYSLKHVMLAVTSTPQGITTLKKTHRKLSAFIITCIGETLGIGHSASFKMSKILRSTLPDRSTAMKPMRHERISAYLQQAYSLFRHELRKAVDVLRETSSDEGEALEIQFKVMFGRLTELILRPVAYLKNILRFIIY